MSVRTAEAGDLVSDGLLPSGAVGTAFSVARGFPTTGRLKMKRAGEEERAELCAHLAAQRRVSRPAPGSPKQNGVRLSALLPRLTASPSWLATCREIPRVGHYKRLERTVRHGVPLEASPRKVPLL